ncbi:type 1 fimbrial protein, partial [Salmonella enterica]|nr:type 1 fimbrial protein [Salmonella enterica]
MKKAFNISCLGFMVLMSGQTYAATTPETFDIAFSGSVTTPPCTLTIPSSVAFDDVYESDLIKATPTLSGDPITTYPKGKLISVTLNCPADAAEGIYKLTSSFDSCLGGTASCIKATIGSGGNDQLRILLAGQTDPTGGHDYTDPVNGNTLVAFRHEGSVTNQERKIFAHPSTRDIDGYLNAKGSYSATMELT